MANEMPEPTRLDILESQLDDVDSRMTELVLTAYTADMLNAAAIENHDAVLERFEEVLRCLVMGDRYVALDALRGGTREELNGTQEGH